MNTDRYFLRHAGSARHLLVTTLLLAALATLPGCGTDDGDPDGEPGIAHGQPDAGAPTGPVTDWIAIDDPTPPELWLLSHRHHRPVTGRSAESDAVAELLANAARRFQEDARMIANRAHQLEAMLGDADMPEDAVTLIERFLALPDTPRFGRFSANCQHYFNLRQQGLDADSALAALVKG